MEQLNKITDLAILGALVGYQPNNNQSNYRDTSKDTKTNGKYGQFLAGEFEGGCS
jgi:hypothetical protein